ncbi:IclR family transcriptional regulator [Xanthobacter sp. VNH20]|jgi:IclR family transcriptional regulator, KDG regulon repressor|uniref:IclR family transcriptional regulator n=1 Tax=Xanthobacter sp. VNH20 TaxID=3156616 RepID=UPI0032B45D8C
MIRAVERALAIFDAFDSQHQSLSLLEIGERIGMPKATTFRLVNTLQNGGFLVRLEDQRYCLSLKILRLAGLVKSTLGIRDMSRSIMVETCRATGETVTLNIRSGIERICVEVVDTPSPLMTIVRPGEHVSLLQGATARLLLAYAKDAEIEDIIQRTPGSQKIDLAQLRAALATIRQQGYACTTGQRIPGVTAISVPIFDMNNEVHYSLSLTGPSIRMDGRLQEFKRILIEAGAALSAMMGTSHSPFLIEGARREDGKPVGIRKKAVVARKLAPART